MTRFFKGYSTYKDVASIAERLLEKSGWPQLKDRPAIDIVKIAREYCRFDVAEVPDLNLGGPVLGAFVPEFDLILLKADCLETRKRFSLAHELGHAQIEHEHGSNPTLFKENQAVYFRCEDGDVDSEPPVRSARPRSEILANKFASYLLMPESIVKDVWRQRRDEAIVAELLSVSRQALGFRLEELRLV